MFVRGLVLLLITLLGFVLEFSGNQGVRLYFLDVGQGDATLIKHKGKTILVDTGRGEIVMGELAKYLGVGKRRIDILIITHLHFDHYGGLLEVLKSYEVGQIYINWPAEESVAELSLQEELRKADVKVLPLLAGDEITIGDLKIDCLWPTKEYVRSVKDMNDLSIVLRGEYGSSTFLLTADFEFSNDYAQRVLGKVTSATLVKVPHQGSVGSLTKKLLGSMSAEALVLSVGRKNQYGHPAPETVQLAEELSLPLFRTDRDGTIEIQIDKQEEKMRVIVR